MNSVHERLRSLPSINSLLESTRGQSLITQYSYNLTLETLRAVLERTRLQIRHSDSATLPSAAYLLEQAEQELISTNNPSLRPVINATGVIIHTNLGRAPLSDDAQQAVLNVAGAYNTLEFDLDSGKRGSRNAHAEQLLPQLTGAQAALVINNAASALVLTLSALASQREVIVSRGQLVEIGGGFRIPEIMAQSGAKLIEVGTTNKTRSDDYQAAITEQTAMLLRVHASNFLQVGFVQSTSIAQMATVAASHSIYTVDDIGSGALLDTTRFGLAAEPRVQDSIANGADLVLFSGDKLLGGPQAGVIVGQAALVNKLKQHPLARVLRADKMTLAALTATLRHYQRGEALAKIPIWWMITRDLAEIEAVAHHWADYLGSRATVQIGESTVGGGSLPGATLPTKQIVLTVDRPDRIASQLRQGNLPVITRIQDDRIIIDPRTVFPSQEQALLKSVVAVLQ